MPGYIKNFPVPLGRMVWLRLHLTNLCNFDCPGCHVFKLSPNRIPATNMPYEVAEKAILFFSELMKKYYPGEKWIYLSIYGGEPLLNRPVLYKLLERFGKNNDGINLNWVLNTNGSLLNEEDLEHFLPNEVDIHMSVDGWEKKHNETRRDKLGRGTFKRVMKAVDLINQKNYPYLQFDSVANPNDLTRINEVTELAAEKGIARVHLDFFYSPDYPHDFSPEAYGQAYAQACLYGLSRGVGTLEGTFSHLYLNFWNDYNISAIPLLLRFPTLYFYADGSFSFNELPTIRPFDSIDSLTGAGLDDIWRRRAQLLLELEKEIKMKCQDCPIFAYCGGNTRKLYRYHTLSAKNEDKICAAVKNAVMELARWQFNPYWR